MAQLLIQELVTVHKQIEQEDLAVHIRIQQEVVLQAIIKQELRLDLLTILQEDRKTQAIQTDRQQDLHTLK